jgi:hypothetical protein
VLYRAVSATYFCQYIEAILACLLLLISLAAPESGGQHFARVENAIRRLARRPRAAALSVVAGVIIARMLLVPLVPVPAPVVHDEFSYLLAGETFASGRITNRPHSFWQHFESVHILQQPTYMSMYQPGQGLFLAVGIRTTGLAWAGVVLSMALLCGALLWALQGWFPSQWALAVTLIAVVRWGLVSYWMNSYWGGAVPALGGALIFGSIPRLARHARIRDITALGLGLALLANTRPYEGLIVSLVSVVVLLCWAKQTSRLSHLAGSSKLAAMAAIAVLIIGGIALYNTMVVKSPFLLPYVKDRQEYAIAPLFIWAQLRRTEPKYNSASLRRVYLDEVKRYHSARAKFGIPEVFRKLKNIWIFFFGPLLSMPFVSFLVLRHAGAQPDWQRKRRYVSVILLVTLAALFQAVFFFPHYAAPAFPAFLAMILLGMRELRQFEWRGRPAGLFLSRAIPVGCVLMAAIPASAHALGWRLSPWPLQWALGTLPEVHSPHVELSVLADGKKALVFVEYGPDHDVGYEWVYNAANIDQEPIVWAREISPESDTALMRYFHDRSVWIVKPDAHPIVLIRLHSHLADPVELNELNRTARSQKAGRLQFSHKPEPRRLGWSK